MTFVTILEYACLLDDAPTVTPIRTTTSRAFGNFTGPTHPCDDADDDEDDEDNKDDDDNTSG